MLGVRLNPEMWALVLHSCCLHICLICLCFIALPPVLLVHVWEGVVMIRYAQERERERERRREGKRLLQTTSLKTRVGQGDDMLKQETRHLATKINHWSLPTSLGRVRSHTCPHKSVKLRVVRGQPQLKPHFHTQQLWTKGVRRISFVALHHPKFILTVPSKDKTCSSCSCREGQSLWKHLQISGVESDGRQERDKCKRESISALTRLIC